MAEESDIENVMDLLPEDSDWDNAKVSSYLDGGKSVYGVVQAFWESRAARLYTAIDVQESGSSRSLSRLYDNALKQAEYWASRVEAEEAQEEEDSTGHISFNTITRI